MERFECDSEIASIYQIILSHLYFFVDPYNIYKERPDVCLKCFRSILNHQPVDKLFCRRGPFWSRHICHASHSVLSDRDRSSDLRLETYRKKRSAQVYLLLLELGLPQDVAWPIVAIAYWLL